jgi:hypothetical protein
MFIISNIRQFKRACSFVSFLFIAASIANIPFVIFIDNERMLRIAIGILLFIFAVTVRNSVKKIDIEPLGSVMKIEKVLHVFYVTNIIALFVSLCVVESASLASLFSNWLSLLLNGLLATLLLLWVSRNIKKAKSLAVGARS